MRQTAILMLGAALPGLCGCAGFAGARPAPAADSGPAAAPRAAAPESYIDESHLVSNFVQHTFSGVGRDFDPDISPDGRTLLYASTRDSQTADLFYKFVNGHALTQLTSDPGDEVQPRFAPDGERIAFASNRGGNWNIWLVRRNGAGLTQLTHEPMDEIAPSWSPDGKQIAFCVWGRRARQWEIWSLRVDEPGTRRFLAYGMFPSWSPSGTRIAFQRARERGDRWFSIWTIDLVGDDVRTPTEVAYRDDSACIAPCWAPGGKVLAYAVTAAGSTPQTHGRTPAADIWLTDIETGATIRAAEFGPPSFNPVWSPDGRVYFVAAAGGSENIWSLDAADEPIVAIRMRARRSAAPAPARMSDAPAAVAKEPDPGLADASAINVPTEIGERP